MKLFVFFVLGFRGKQETNFYPALIFTPPSLSVPIISGPHNFPNADFMIFVLLINLLLAAL